MSKSNLQTKHVGDLLEEAFLIPAYQRGYRWSTMEVRDLLNDVLDFIKDPNESEYCLQPVVVTAAGNKWEVIDGQQRLTTIFLILNYLNLRFVENKRRKLYSIEYATREKSQAFLSDINEEQKDDNIDFFHIFNAHATIKEWLTKHDNKANDIESAFLNKVIVIWYEVPNTTDPINIFTRLNVGKIPLTQSELIKALFLQKKNFETRSSKHEQRRIANEWDEIERALQEDSFWFFLTNKNTASNRIEFVLQLVADEIESNGASTHDKLRIFLTFYGQKKDDGSFESIERWNSVKQVFMTIEEWYADRQFFHLIGFLVATEGNIRQLYNDYRNRTSRSEFRTLLHSKIYKKLTGQSLSDDLTNNDIKDEIKKFIEELDYDNGVRARSRITETLLLFNVATLLRSTVSNHRFQFDRYKAETWDIEHIHAVASEMRQGNIPAHKQWLSSLLSYYLGRPFNKTEDTDFSSIEVGMARNLCEKGAGLLQSEPFDEDAFFVLFSEIMKHLDKVDIVEGEEEASSGVFPTDHGLGNLTLLDSTTNRSYKNAIYSIKRQCILDLDKESRFIPVCTKNVFLKYYSGQNIPEMFIWSERDKNAYKEAVIDMLTNFFTVGRKTG